ncbi:hypothetical protein K504DRAFT_208218 [Pleomassaria siparia CBS 279.74]|uniref:FAD-binding FR-type domain-containing protein n=1 Tax=Pleomassaria siparia CBS 279.74 TaxID=1314801 RepID=A0A6G1KJR6_9PLEO|nr:hypothetical protein K504DRAFT_208218 [Pleomassaria siparia CBS 279.74]
MDDLPISWFQDILRFSLKATASTSPPWISAAAEGRPGLTDPKDPGKDPRFRELAEAVLFSRRFLQTYNLALAGILLLLTAWHWGEKAVLARRKRRNRNAAERINETWSSSSSTIEGTATPPGIAKLRHSEDETTPLLTNESPKRTSPGIKKPYFIIKSWLQYQPSPIPIINKTLPPNSVSLLVLAFLALNVFYNFYRMSLSSTYLFVFADRCGILFVANLPILYLLAAKTQPIKLLTGYSYESLNIFHRRAGELLCFEALLHFLGMDLIWYFLLRHLGFTLARFLFNRVVGLGLGAFVAYEVLYFTSLGSFRQRCYEIFLALHVFLQFAGLVLLWFHHHTSRLYVGISMAIFIVDRITFRLWLKSSSHPATLTILEDDETLLLSSNWDTSPRSSALLPKSMAHGWKPNDHVFITIPSLGNKYILQAHPFTIFSAAPEYSDSDSTPSHAFFTLLIRAQSKSGFTHDLLTYARTHHMTQIRLDGPYGSSHALDILSSSDTAVVIAGGSGIAVAYPLLWALLHPSSNAITDPETGGPSSSSPPSISSSANPLRKFKLLWITHSASHRAWIPEEKLEELQAWGLDLFITPPTALAGRPAVSDILRSWAEERNGSTGVVVSGPDGLVRDVRNTCAALIKRGDSVQVQVEKFGW